MNIAHIFGSLCAAATAIMAILSAPRAGALRLVQYNAEWLFVNHYSQFDCPGTQCTWKNVSEAETHLSYVARVVDYLTPDIVNFCEVEGVDELQMVADLQVAVADYTPYLIPGTDTATGQNVGMLSRIAPSVPLYRTEEKYAYPIPGSRCGYTGAPSTTGVSKHYITEFSLWENLPVALISAHLIAIPTDPARCAQREAQATILRKVINSYLEKQYGVIVIGDMNDYDGEVLDVNQNIPKSGVLDILKGIAADNSTILYSVGDRLLPMERYSDWWDSDSNCNTESVLDYSMIDHILVSPNIQKYITNVFVYHGYAEYCGKYDSDHFPVVVDFAEPVSTR
jgi:exonuclease III